MGLAVWETDAHNIIPCWLASDKLEFAARTIRPKINRQLSAC
jgi:deoxyribodipyrimidine photo-lyase